MTTPSADYEPRKQAWLCEQCHRWGEVIVGEDAGVYVVVNAIEDHHARWSPECAFDLAQVRVPQFVTPQPSGADVVRQGDRESLADLFDLALGRWLGCDVDEHRSGSTPEMLADLVLDRFTLTPNDGGGVS